MANIKIPIQVGVMYNLQLLIKFLRKEHLFQTKSVAHVFQQHEYSYSQSIQSRFLLTVANLDLQSRKSLMMQ